MAAKSMFLKKNVTYLGTQLKAWDEITADHEAFESFLADGFMVSSKSLALNETKSIAKELDKSSDVIKQKDAEIAQLKKDLEDAVATIKQLQGDESGEVDEEDGEEQPSDEPVVVTKKARK